MEVITKFWDNLNTKNSVVLLGIAPIEQHGRHLPLGVDFYLTQKWISAVESKLEKQTDIEVYKVPIIALGNADIRGFKGNIHVSQKLIYRVVKEVLFSISDWDIKNIIVISAHADPKHQIAIEQACEHVNKKMDVVAFSPMGAIFSGDELGIDVNKDEKVNDMLKLYPNDFHAGWVETSLMLYYDSNNVNEDYKYVEDIEIKPKEMISAKTVSRRMGDYGHLGYPRLANKELGQKLHEDMSDTIFEAVMCFINRKGYKKYKHHYLYKIPFLKAKKFRR